MNEDEQAELLRALGGVRTELLALREQAKRLVPREELEDRTRRFRRNLIAIAVLAVIAAVPLLFVLSQTKSTGDEAKVASRRLTQDQYDRAVSGYNQCVVRNAQTAAIVGSIHDLFDAEKLAPQSPSRDARLEAFQRFLDRAGSGRIDCNIYIAQAQSLERAGARPAPNFPPVSSGPT